MWYVEWALWGVKGQGVGMSGDDTSDDCDDCDGYGCSMHALD